MLPLASLLSLVIPRQSRVQIVLLAMICAVAHLFGGGWRQVIGSFWPFLIYSATLTTWLKRSGRDAFVLTAFVHALYNATFIGVGAIGNYIAAPGVSRTDSAVILPAAMAGGNTGLVLCQVGGQ